jgi:hypothetical protein
LRNRTKICGAERNKQEDEHRNKEATLNAEEARGMQGCRDAQKWLQVGALLASKSKNEESPNDIYLVTLPTALSAHHRKKCEQGRPPDRQTARPRPFYFDEKSGLLARSAVLCCTVLWCGVVCIGAACGETAARLQVRFPHLRS